VASGVEGETGGDERARRRVRSMHRPMRKTFAGNFLDRGLRPRAEMTTNEEVAAFLQGSAMADLDGKAITGPSPEGDEHIARMMAAEAVAAVNRSGGKSSLTWYTDAIRRAVNVAALMHPELSDDDAARAADVGFADAADARCVFFVALAVCSQNNEVRETTRYAMEQFRAFLEGGRFVPKVYGQKGGSVASNLARFNMLLEACEGEVATLREFLSTPFTMGEVREAAAAFGMEVGARELVDERVMGSIVFGPKIGGGFYQNLAGNGGVQAVTMDLWFMRTWGRYTGTLVRGELLPEQRTRLADGVAADIGVLAPELRKLGVDPDRPVSGMPEDEVSDLCRALRIVWERQRRELVAAGGADNAAISALKARMGWPGAAEAIQKTLSAPVDAPSKASDRRWIRSVVKRSLDILRQRGYPMTAADLQATLWYPEKDLWNALSSRKVLERNASYDEALADTARAEGHSHEAISAALDSLLDHRSGARGVPGPDRRRGSGAGEGVPQGARRNRRDPPEGLSEPVLPAP
jgi:hypothetical protein